MVHTDQQLPLDLKSLTEILIRHFGIHEGNYQLNLGFKIALGGFEMDPHTKSVPLPGAIFGVDSVSLVRIPGGIDVPNAVDAAIVNPVPKAKLGPRTRKLK